LLQEIVYIFGTKFTFDFLKIAENFWILIFYTYNKQW